VNVPSTGRPKFVMVGIDKPDGQVRLYASREIPDRELRWGIEHDRYGTATGWHIDAEMRHVLTIDGPTWAWVFARAFEIWANHDRNEAEEAELQAKVDKRLEGRKAIRGRHPNLVIHDEAVTMGEVHGSTITGPGGAPIELRPKP
jgi:hypothetical protein